MSRAFVVGTAGHVDHGKTALVRALTGVDTDRWEDEKERGLTIDLGFAPLRVDESVEIGIVDVPGHEDFVTNMLAGATGLDLLLLVVAADEGPMPQTREHLTIAHLLGVDEGVVALTKVDRVEEEWLELAREAVREELRTVLDHDDWPVLPVSSTEGTGVEALRAEIEGRADRVRGRPPGDLFRLPVDRSFTIRGAGTVVTGTAWSGTVRRDDEVRILPGDLRSRVRSLQVHGEDRDAVSGGRRCAMALVGVDPGDVPRGSTLVTSDRWRAVDRLGVRLRLPPHAMRSVEDGQRVRVYLGTREVMARAELPVAGAGPGDTLFARLSLEKPLVARAGDRFVLRFYSPVVTIGGGRVAEPEPGAGWEGRTDEWTALLDGSPETALEAAARLAGGRGLADAEVPLATGLPVDRARALVADPPSDVERIGDRWFAAGQRKALRTRLLGELRRLHREERRAPGASLEALRTSVAARVAGDLLERVLRELSEEGEIVVDGPRVRLPSHEPVLTGEEEEKKEALRRTIAEGGLEPPTVGELGAAIGADDDLLHDLLALLAREGRVEEVSPELYLSDEAAETVRRGARRVLERGTPAGVPDFKEEYEVTRKYLIPFLEYLDRAGVTRRTGDGRVAAE